MQLQVQRAANVFWKKGAAALKVSVIISVYNMEKYLRECLDSATGQTLKDIEIVCVDDGSTDRSLEILQEYAAKDGRIKLMARRNSGPSVSRNVALKHAAGEYVLFLDSDDHIRKDAAELLYNKAAGLGLDMLSFGGTNFDGETGEFISSPYYEFRCLPEGFNDGACFNYKDCADFITRMAVSSCLTMYKLSFIKASGIEFPPRLRFEDNLFFCRALLSAKKCGILKDRLYFRRVHSASLTQNQHKHHLDYIKVAGMLLDWLKSINVQSKIYDSYREAYTGNAIARYNNFEEEYKRKYYKALTEFVKRYGPQKLYAVKMPKAPLLRRALALLKREGFRGAAAVARAKAKAGIKARVKRLVRWHEVENLRAQAAACLSDESQVLKKQLADEAQALNSRLSDGLGEVGAQVGEAA